jgi:hypothetical protein
MAGFGVSLPNAYRTRADGRGDGASVAWEIGSALTEQS